jgi:FemAB family protein
MEKKQSDSIIKIIFKTFDSVGLKIIKRQNNKVIWDNTLNKSSYIPVSYTNPSLDYQLAYLNGNGRVNIDVSIIIYQDTKPIALWPLTISLLNTNIKLTSFSETLSPPLFINECSNNTQKKINKKCIDFIYELSNQINIKSLETVIFSNDKLYIQNWQTQLLRLGGSCNILHELLVNLNLELNEIKSNFRTSYKSLINSGEKLWNVKILDKPDRFIWNEFKQLHLCVSGKKTRSDETWELQFESVKNNTSILIYLQDSMNKMVGAGLFDFSKDEAIYAVGAYNRNLFDKPLGHIVQFHAIQELKKRNLKWYKIGIRHYVNDFNSPSTKEISIGEFKEGFATHILSRYHIKLDLNL